MKSQQALAFFTQTKWFISDGWQTWTNKEGTQSTLGEDMMITTVQESDVSKQVLVIDIRHYQGCSVTGNNTSKQQ